tara:strand:- start:1019 stop:2146 length:1128 start_codon:yes stop_codon:yes gene_type:complete
MKIKNIDSLDPTIFTDEITSFIDSLRLTNNSYSFLPCLKGATQAGRELKLGFSCYALKTYFTLNKWNNFDEDYKNEWGQYINSFQKKSRIYPDYSFLDDAYIDNFNKFRIERFTKDFVKKLLNLSKKYNYQSKKFELQTSIRAETKQAISTLQQVNFSNKYIYDDFPKTENEIKNYLNEYDWSKPWSAGAQFSGLCVFVSTQLDDNLDIKTSLENYINSKVNSDGFYYSGEKPNYTELINGSMKVLTGLDWLNVPIHFPEKIIDLCLSGKPSQQGCDLVDFVYVLYRCSLETNYRKKDIIKYLENFYETIFNHFYPNQGGFSYGIDSSQKLYYGVEISNGNNEPDIHGTLLLTWALSMIFKITENENYDWKVLKP